MDFNIYYKGATSVSDSKPELEVDIKLWQLNVPQEIAHHFKITWNIPVNSTLTFKDNRKY